MGPLSGCDVPVEVLVEELLSGAISVRWGIILLQDRQAMCAECLVEIADERRQDLLNIGFPLPKLVNFVN